MSNITPFVFEGHSVTVISDDDGSLNFIAMEIAEVLDYSDTEALTRRLDDDEKQNRQIVGFGNRGVTIISESGLYSAILGSTKPQAKPFQKWVRSEVLPSIRKTGSYSMAPRSPGEILMLQAQAFYQLEQAQAKIAADMQRLETQVEDLAESRVWDQCPQNCEPITKIRIRMNERYGLPDWVVDTVVWKLPLSPKPHGMVRNHREEANGSQYAVYAVADITRVFAQFVDECVQETAMRASHRHIGRMFQLLRDGKKPKPLKAHTNQEFEPA
nr:BRO family protein [Comamonas thiooxydans]